MTSDGSAPSSQVPNSLSHSGAMEKLPVGRVTSSLWCARWWLGDCSTQRPNQPQSASMRETLQGDPSITKKDTAADEINKLLMSIVVSCTQNIGEGPRHYFDVGVIGYGSGNAASFCFGGRLAGRRLVSIPELAANQLKVQPRTKIIKDDNGNIVETQVRFPIWFEAKAENGTPMVQAFRLATNELTMWTSMHMDSYPPIVINITDGEPNVDPAADARALMRLGTNDGKVLIYNVHLSKLASTPITFPGSPAGLPDNYAKRLFEMSSELPLKIRQELEAEDLPAPPGARGFIFNADSEILIKFLDIGTRLAREEAPEYQ